MSRAVSSSVVRAGRRTPRLAKGSGWRSCRAHPGPSPRIACSGASSGCGDGVHVQCGTPEQRNSNEHGVGMVSFARNRADVTSSHWPANGRAQPQATQSAARAAANEQSAARAAANESDAFQMPRKHCPAAGPHRGWAAATPSATRPLASHLRAGDRFGETDDGAGDDRRAAMTTAAVGELCARPAEYRPTAAIAARRRRADAAAGRRRAEVATVLRLAGRFSGVLSGMPGRVEFHGGLERGLVAVWLRMQIAQLAGQSCALHWDSVAGGGCRVQVTGAVSALAQRVGLLDRRGRPIRGLPPVVVGDPDPGVAAAVWRGAFLARGALSNPADAPQIRVLCPGPEPALALIGAARRLGVTPAATLRPAPAAQRWSS